jgi:hypothetical protein
MKEGISVTLTEFSLAMILIVALGLGVGFEYIHRPIPQPAPEPCATKPPEITIEQTFYIPVPAPVVQVVPQPPADTPDVVAPHDEDDQDPVFQHRTPIITDALRTPMSEMAKN